MAAVHGRLMWQKSAVRGVTTPSSRRRSWPMLVGSSCGRLLKSQVSVIDRAEAHAGLEARPARQPPRLEADIDAVTDLAPASRFWLVCCVIDAVLTRPKAAGLMS